jgi:hypothetical protein
MLADCPADYEKILWLLGELAPIERAQVTAHINSCHPCAEDMASLRRMAELLAVGDRGGEEEAAVACLDEAELGVWVEGTLDSAARARALSHVAECSRCRRAATSLIETLRSESVTQAVKELEQGNFRERAGTGGLRRLPRRYRVGAVAAAIAAVVAGVVFLRPTDLEIGEAPTHREALPGAISLPQPIAPLGELEAVEAFAWSPVSGADRYRLTVFDDEGTVIWETETEEPRLAPPTSVLFETGAQFFWKVVARVGFDRWVDSELVTFTISQP